MAMSASLKIVNNCGYGIIISSVDQVNHCWTWSAPPTNKRLYDPNSVTIEMGNDSPFIAPLGVGADVKFKVTDIKEQIHSGRIYFNDPGVGEHSFNFENTEYFEYKVTNPEGNSYEVTITLKKDNRHVMEGEL